MASKRKKNKKLPLIIIGSVLVLVVAGSFLYNYRAPGGLTTKGAPGAQPPQVLGRDDARVKIEEFGDFQCPSCGILHPVLKKLEAEYGDRMSITFREFPMATLHSNALEAARAAEAAGLQGRFWQMHDRLYDYQAAWSDSDNVRAVFEQYAKDMGLDSARLIKDMDSEKVKDRLAADQRRGASLGVDGTPTVLINGRLVPDNAINESGLRSLIDAALKQP
jgi:protein-disulfide isomerase